MRAASSSSSRDAVRLEGMTGSEPTTREIAYDHLTEIRIGRSAEERIDGRPSLVLAPRTGETLSIASVAQSGVVAEIAERLAALQLERRPRPPHRRRPAAPRETRTTPFEPCSRQARRSIRRRSGSTATRSFSPPRKQCSSSSPISGPSALEPLLAEPELWQSAAAWHDYLAGPPQIAEDVFSWDSRPHVRNAR